MRSKQIKQKERKINVRMREKCVTFELKCVSLPNDKNTHEIFSTK